MAQYDQTIQPPTTPAMNTALTNKGGIMRTWWCQFSALFMKNLFSIFKQKVAMLSLLLIAAMAVLAMEGIRSLIESTLQTRTVYYESYAYARFMRVSIWSMPVAVVLFLTLPPLFVAAHIGEEKRAGLLDLLRMVGLCEHAYWFSWELIFGGLLFIVALFYTFAGHVFFPNSLAFFSHSAVLVHVFLSWSYMMSIMGMTTFFMSFLKRPRIVQAIQCVFLIFVLIFQFLYPVIFGPKALVKASNWLVLILFPSYGFTYGFEVIARSSGLGFTLNGTELHVVGRGELANSTKTYDFTMVDFFSRPNYNSSYVGGYFVPAEDEGVETSYPAVGIVALYLWGITFLYLFLAWYFAQICGGGVSQKLYFPFSPSYWSPKSKTEFVAGDKRGEMQALSQKKQSVIIHKLSKNYKSSSAVTELSLTMQSNSLFVVLGQNGAGKSTTIGMLSGVTQPTHGEAYLLGYSIRTDMQSIQKCMGVCPQDDILFEHLSGKQNLQFWCQFRALAPSETKEHIQTLLSGVDLLGVQNNAAGSYSGGMKRRLSLACAAVGKPKILFLDEPTTGMDPHTRRMVWKTIESLKKDAVVVMTTHNMEEADYLGDAVGIMANGRLRALGTPMQLKDEFGTGLYFNINVVPDMRMQVLEKLRRMLPSAETLLCAGATINLGVPKTLVRVLPETFRTLEEEQATNANTGIIDWSISHTTLEEVFLRIAVSNRTVNADLGFSSEAICVACSERKAECVTLFTKTSVPVRVDGVCCAPCADGTEPPTVEDIAALVSGTNPDGTPVMNPDGTPMVQAAVHPGGTPVLNPDGTPMVQAAVHPDGTPVLNPDGTPTQYQGLPAVYPDGTPVLNADGSQMMVNPDGTPFVAEGNSKPGMPSPKTDKEAIKDMARGNPNGVSQMRALMFKAATVQAKQKKGNICRGICCGQLAVAIVGAGLMANMAPPQAGRNGQVNTGQVTTIAYTTLLAMMFFPVLISQVASEHTQQLVKLMRVHSMKMRYYWLSTYCWYSCLYLIIMAVCTAVIAATNKKPDFHWGWYALLVFLGNHAQIGVAFLFAGLLMRSSVLGLAAYGYTILSVGLGAALMAILENKDTPTGILVLPPVAFMEGFKMVWNGNVPKNPLIALTIAGTAGLLIGIFLLMAVGGEMSPMQQYWEKFLAKRLQKRARIEGKGCSEDDDEDCDVTEERRRAEEVEDTICVRGVGKQYVGSGKTWAVRDLTFGVPRGECFGLLGTNGAGKTSALSMMSGSSLVTYGKISIAGYNVETNRPDVIRNLGVCPQFDFIFEDLTVEEHLLLYARLKGVPRKTEKILVYTVAGLLGLDGDPYTKLASNLSGGMRRRMMISFTMLTFPDVVLLDEPTTGTDPETRRDVWKSLETLKEDRSIILTTHSMEEADALCDRIGIMALGSLKCLGRATHLKQKFGTGYRIKLAASNHDEVLDFLVGLIPDATVAKQNGTLLEITVPAGRAMLATIFEGMQRNKEALGITEWSCGQTTLDDVFNRIADAAIVEKQNKACNIEVTCDGPSSVVEVSRE